MRKQGAPMRLTIRADGGRSIGSGEDTMLLRFEDSTSGVTIMEARFSLKGMMEVLTGRSGVEAEAEIYIDGAQNWGLKAEHKREVIAIPSTDRKKFAADYAKAVAPFEVDGWKAQNETSYNMHRRKDDGYEALFYRFVPIEAEA